MKFLPAFFFLVFIHSIAQVDKNNSVLWQISGNNLTAPSYLFGTIHVTDKRVFNFQDSVLAKLKQCDVTAFELNFDSVSGRLLSNVFEKKKRKKAKELLTDAEMEKLKKVFREKNIPIDNLDKESPSDIYQKYQNAKYKNNKMSTFLDAYIFGLAKKYGKGIIGLESYEEQIMAINTLKDTEQKKMLVSLADSLADSDPVVLRDSMIMLYLTENINGMYGVFHESGREEYENIILTKRNYIMDKRIDSLIQKKSAFICVGSGHLAGNEGLIELLHKRGYILTPVKSARTGYYKELLPDENAEDNWNTVIDENGGYQVKMPGPATIMKVSGVEMKGYMDLGGGYFYLSTAVPSEERIKSAQRTIDAIVERYENRAKFSSKKQITFNGMEGYEISMDIPNVANYVIRVVSDTGNTYTLMIGVANKTPEKKLVKRFFNSLAAMKKKAVPEIIFREDTAAFKISVPSSFKLSDYSPESSSTTKTYSCFDYESGIYISVSCVDYGPGFYVPDLEELYSKSIDNLSALLKNEPEYGKDIILRGYKGKDYKITATDNSVMFVRYIMRGSRFYTISAGSREKGKTDEALKRIESFDFLPVINSKLISYTEEEKNFKVLVPGEVKFEADSENLTEIVPVKEYGASDPYTNNWIKIYAHHFSDYEYLKNDSELFTFFKRYIYTENETTRDSSCYTVNNHKVLDFKSSIEKNPDILKRTRIVINGQQFYMLMALDNSLFPNDSLYGKLFDSFEILHNDNSFDVFTQKAGKLLIDLNSKDSLTRERAGNEFYKFNFEKKDLNALGETLKNKFPDDSSYSVNTRYRLYNKIYSLLDSSEILPFIQKNYHTMPDTGNIRLNALNKLANINTEESIDLWKHYLLEARPKIKNSYSAYQCMARLAYDSIPFIKKLFPELVQLMNDQDYKLVYYTILANALKHKLLGIESFSSLSKTIYKDAVTEYKHMSTPEADNTMYYSGYFDKQVYLLDLLPASDEIIELNKQISSDTIIYSKINSFLYLVKNNVELNRVALKKFLDVISRRNEFYAGLEKINRLDAFPASLKKQKILAEGDMYNAAQIEDEGGTLEFLEERKINYKGFEQRFFLYKINYGEDYTYFGIAGPYPLKDKNLVPYGSKTTVSMEEFDKKTIEEHVDELLQEN